jgi:hypothetical protein
MIGVLNRYRQERGGKIQWIAQTYPKMDNLTDNIQLAREGFELALRMGADFLTVGMFDFQVSEDAAVMRDLLTRDLARQRPWRS